MADREELMRNAVSFLVDPKTQASPLTQRIQFLEAKGLTQPEIEIAMRQASTNQSIPASYQANYPGFGYPYPAQRWDWRDYFIGAVVSGTVAYGVVSLFKKYVQPHLQPPDTTVYEGDRDALTAQFDAAEALLKEIQSETAAIRTAVEDQKERVDKTVRDVEAVVTEMRQGETTTRDEMREIREEIDTIREMLPKMLEKNKESHGQSMAELQQELRSLKALLMSRGPSISSIPSPAPLVGRPSIPAWQLSSAPATASSTPTPVVDPTLPNGVTSEKGKEVAAT
ncbi:peroxisomal membrane protein pex14 [Marasmius tenuissimus]|uniref:Peroxisomal membrane protein PEX14 n=1 Tax=Marasmius tenuissimus TaxID=585030 RepID=A0ABR3AEY5_9AGAR